MYMPKTFIETDKETICQFIEQFPLATMVCHSDAGLEAHHIPLILQKDMTATAFEYHIIGHFAKANPVWQHANSEWLIIFSDNGSYISPNWYPNKALTHKEVPTWNYRAVHIQGKMHLVTENFDDKIAILDKLTQYFERNSPKPWQLSDAPADYLAQLAKVIVAFRFEITDIQCKYKMSQNKNQENMQGVISGLESLQSPQASETADIMKQIMGK